MQSPDDLSIDCNERDANSKSEVNTRLYFNLFYLLNALRTLQLRNGFEVRDDIFTGLVLNSSIKVGGKLTCDNVQ